MALRALLVERDYAPATVNFHLAALRRATETTMTDAQRLQGQLAMPLVGAVEFAAVANAASAGVAFA